MEKIEFDGRLDIKKINARIFQIKDRLQFDDNVTSVGNPATLHRDDRHDLISELDRLYWLKMNLQKLKGEK